RRSRASEYTGAAGAQATAVVVVVGAVVVVGRSVVVVGRAVVVVDNDEGGAGAGSERSPGCGSKSPPVSGPARPAARTSTGGPPERDARTATTTPAAASRATSPVAAAIRRRERVTRPVSGRRGRPSPERRRILPVRATCAVAAAPQATSSMGPSGPRRPYHS